MTTALIGREDSVRAHARVGLVSRQGFSELAEAVAQAGHEAVACASWSELCDEARTAPVDIVLCHEPCLEDLPGEWATPVVRVEQERDLTEDALAPLLSLAVELAAKVDRLAGLERFVAGIRSGAAMVGNTPPMRRLQSAVARAADCDASVLIEGPPGSGKSLAARSVHLKSRRGDKPLAVFECRDLSAEQLTQALTDCHDTTLLLESVDELPASAQSVLVKHLKERSTSRAPSLVRLIATTSAHVPELVARGAFREDLFYRLHAFPIVVPSLHERADDIPALAVAILDAGVPASGCNHRGFTPAARILLESMQWPGNVAQLEATVRRGHVLAGGGPIDREHLMSQAPGGAPAASPAARDPQADEVELTEDAIRPFEEEEKYLLGRALRATKGNVRRAAQLLGIGRATLYRKIQQYHLRLH